MKKWQTWVIIGLAIALIISILTRPGKYDLDGKAYQDSTKRLKQEKAVIQSKQNDKNRAYQIRVKNDSINLALQDSKIQALQKKATTQRTVVQTIIENNPDLESFIGTQQEIINEQQIQIDTLKRSVEFHKKMHDELIAVEYQEDKIEAQMQIDCANRIADLEKAAKNKSPKRLGNILKNVGKGAGIGFIGYLIGKG
jgi:hypothetical protein